MTEPSAEDVYVEHRPLLFSIAYEILGSVADAEDVLHDCYERWSAVDLAGIDHPRAYLAQMVTRQALMALRSARRRREDYIGPWLPEPLATDTTPDPLDHVLTGEAVTTAMLLVLETLTPTQRAVFVLREVFGFDYTEIAVAVSKTEDAVRQINHRARSRVHAGRRTAVATPTDARAVAEKFAFAAASGDLQALMNVLAPDVVFIADGGGAVTAVRRPVRGPGNVARLILGLMTKGQGLGELEIRAAQYNSMPAIMALIDGALDQITTIEVRDRTVTAIYCVRNPAKLSAAMATTNQM